MEKRLPHAKHLTRPSRRGAAGLGRPVVVVPRVVVARVVVVKVG